MYKIYTNFQYFTQTLRMFSHIFSYKSDMSSSWRTINWKLWRDYLKFKTKKIFMTMSIEIARGVSSKGPKQQ